MHEVADLQVPYAMHCLLFFGSGYGLAAACCLKVVVGCF